jgi:hypothetical protein
VTVLFLLCVGVLLGGLTFHSSADSYTLSAVVPAPLPNAPATITSPADQTHFTAEPITVTGTCPENTYVKLNRNDVFSGVAICGTGQTTYQIQTDLSLGSNILVPQVYNVTDQPGPASSPITAWYDNPVQPPAPIPPTPPVTLQVTSQDNISFHSGVVAHVSSNVTERGTAPPYSYVVVTFHSVPLTCATYADSNGNWSCTLDQALPNGTHIVAIVATTPQGRVLTFPVFHIVVLPTILALKHTVSQVPFLINYDFHYQVRTSGQSFDLPLSLSGGDGPYAVTVQWGDGTQSAFARKDGSGFLAGHTYRLSKLSQQTYLVKVEAVDVNGNKTFLQIAQFVHAQGSPIGLQVVSDIGISPPTISQFQQWLWFIWPTYGVVSVMVLSFWLGERQEYYNLFNRKRIRRRA